MRPPPGDVGIPRARNLIRAVSKVGSRSNARKRHGVSSGTSAFAYRVREVTEWNVCGPEKDEISSMNSDFRDGKEPPRKDGGISKVCPTRRGEMLSIRRDGAGSTRCSANRSIWD